VSGKSAAEDDLSAPPDGQAPGLTGPFAGVGRQLRQARMASGMSLREMARRVDVSASLISQIELGRTMPSVGTLYSIASELGVSLDGLMPITQEQPEQPEPAEQPERPMPVPVRRPAESLRRAATQVPRPAAPGPEANSPVQRAGRRHELRIGGAVWGRLTADHDPANDFLHVTYQPGGESCPEDQMIHHRGSEYGFIISGRLHVQVGFNHYDLDQGDSISFPSATPHRLSNPYPQETQSVWLVADRGGTPVL
jgi:transcriptional regulator with XRE-family HTH domain